MANVAHGSRDFKRPLKKGQGDFDSCCYQLILVKATGVIIARKVIKA